MTGHLAAVGRSPDRGAEFRERFAVSSHQLIRTVRTHLGTTVTSVVAPDASGLPGGVVTADDAEQRWLRSMVAPPVGTGRPVRGVDLFSGCGGLSLGLREAARAVGRSFEPVLAVDFDPAALDVYKANFPGGRALAVDVHTVLDGAPRTRLTPVERGHRRSAGAVEVVVGGPPCQGHSDLNNHTRRADHKNELYFTMLRAAEVFEPTHLLVENVPAAIHDRGRVVQRTAEHLSALGYNVSLGVIDLHCLGVPQRRRRLVLAASMTRPLNLAALTDHHARASRGLAWAIDDLAGAEPTTLLDQPARSAPATRRRIDYLFEHGLWELPDHQRPPCHADAAHSYPSIYGRLRWEEPAQTITTGFYSMCMGRYVHPSQRRTLTAHEAARLQFFPDWFDFSAAPGRTALARMIGNAVPSRLTYAVGCEWLA